MKRASAIVFVLISACGGEPGRSQGTQSTPSSSASERSAEATSPGTSGPEASGPQASGPEASGPEASGSEPAEPGGAEASPSPTSSPPTAAPRATEPPAPSRVSCASTAPARQVPLHRPGAVVEVDGRTFLYAWHREALEDPPAVVVSLDASGELVETTLAAGYPDPTAIAAQPDGLLVVWSPQGAAPRMQSLEIRADGVVAARAPREIEGLDQGWPGPLAASASHALLLGRVRGPSGSGDPTGFFVIDLASAHVVRRELSTRVVDVACSGATCAIARLDAMGLEVARVAADGSEHDVVRWPVNRACRELERLEAGGRVAWMVEAAPSVGVVVGPDGLSSLDVTSLPSEAECGETLYPFDHTWPALSTAYRGARPLFAWDPSTDVVGPLGELAADAWESHTSRAFVDGSIEIAYTASAGMMHSPTDRDGVRRYFEAHSFEGGEVMLWQREGGAWIARDRRPLPVANAEGTMSRGYTPQILRHGAHAAVALFSEGLGDAGWIQPYREPCARRATVGPR
ncbi:MAG: hypothetical protein K1X94_25175 [Sandaracinaceae bacterium]|nr:hypothetical protein [Sandaracinaceae bacterium]